MVSSAWAQNTYEISDADELVTFANKVNGGETTANAVLTDDIDLDGKEWIPIGNSTTKYEGTFNGQGYAITGFKYIAKSDEGNGFFGYVRNATIKNFSISGTLTSAGYTYNGTIGAAEANTVISGIHSALEINVSNKGAHTGGILGSTVTSGNPVLIENCEYSGTMTHSGSGDCQAGILGYTYNGGVMNCIFSGTINGEGSKYGGILGYCKVPGFLGVQNCLSIGKIVANSGNTTAAAIIANYNGAATSSVKNNYYCLKEGSTTTIAIGNKASNCEAPVLVTADKLASGEVAYKLNGNKSENVAFYQTLIDDDRPVLDAEHGVIYPAGRTHCDGTPYEGETGYSNAEPAQDDHDYVNGFCSYCQALDENYITANGEGYYEIGTPVQLKWFAALVNQVNTNANAVLTADIDLTGVMWTPIGFGVNYTGTFDGQGFTISNFYLSTTANSSGLFGQASGGAVIKNFTVEGEIVSNGHQYVGGVVGNVPSGTVTISGVHSKVDISCAVSRHGGILGAQTNPSTVNIDRCIYSGTFDAQSTSGNYGGFIGLTNNNNSAYVNITNSVFDGEIINVGDNAGGFIGYTRGCQLTIQNCLSNGTVEATNPGQFIGQLNATSNQKYAGVNYYVADGNTQGTGSATEAGPAPLQATSAQLASGEVAYNLGTAFRQNIGTDAAPVLDATHAFVGKISAAGYATQYIADTDVEIPAGVTAYTAEFENTWLKLNAISDAIAAGEPVVLKGDEGYYSFAPTTGAVKATDNVLKGTAEEIDAEGKYVLAKPADKAVGFYLADGGKIAAGKAYLEVPGTEVKGFTFAEDGETGIVSPLGETEEGVIYNLVGQRVSKLQKGINIVNGKKVLR